MPCTNAPSPKKVSAGSTGSKSISSRYLARDFLSAVALFGSVGGVLGFLTETCVILAIRGALKFFSCNLSVVKHGD